MPRECPYQLEEDGPLVRRLLDERETWRVYGNHKVFCCGKIVIGPVRSWWWVLEIHTIIVTIVFLLEWENYGSILVPISGGIGFLVCFLSSWKTLLCDPGIVKRPPFGQALCNARKVEGILRSGRHYPSRMQEIDGQLQKCVYCPECHLYRPPRSGHCHICDCCVEEIDHHCPVFGSCVGKNNLFAFHVMTISLALYHIFLLISSFAVAAIYTNKHQNPAWWSASWTLNLTIIGALLCCLMPLILSGLECEKEPKPRRSINLWNYAHPQPRSESSTSDITSDTREDFSTETDDVDPNGNP